MSLTPNPRTRIEAQGEDIETARQFFESEYHGLNWDASLTERDFAFRHTALGDAEMTLRTSRFLGLISGEMNPGDDYIVSWLVAGHGTVDIGHSGQQSVLGQPVMYPAERPSAFSFADVEQKLVHFQRPFLERLASEQNGTAPGGLVFDISVVPSPGSMRSWHNTLALVSRTTLDFDASPILQSEMARIAGIALLGMFPAVSTSLPAALYQPRNARLREAVEFIHANAHLAITTTSIAKACDLSVRSLQEGFQREFSVSPNSFLRGIRLDRAHADLIAQGAGSVSVTARRWGFAHLGRFSAAYEERFGQQPHETARA